MNDLLNTDKPQTILVTLSNVTATYFNFPYHSIKNTTLITLELRPTNNASRRKETLFVEILANKCCPLAVAQALHVNLVQYIHLETSGTSFSWAIDPATDKPSSFIFRCIILCIKRFFFTKNIQTHVHCRLVVILLSLS